MVIWTLLALEALSDILVIFCPVSLVHLEVFIAQPSASFCWKILLQLKRIGGQAIRIRKIIDI